jgi:hypothetical protein
MYRNIRGVEGRVEVTGLRAVVAMFVRWSLERRGESQSGKPTWTLRAALSYQKDSLLTNPRLAKQIICKVDSHKSLLVVPGPDSEMKVDGQSLSIEGVTLCPVEPPQSVSPKS